MIKLVFCTVNLFFLGMVVLKVLAVFCLVNYVSAIRFYIPPNGKKCLKEELHKDVVVTGEYELSEAPGMTCSILVKFFISFGNVYNLN